MKRKICFVTDSRAEYSHLYWLMKEIKFDLRLELQIVVCGTHMSKKHGLTYQAIEADGFIINNKFSTLLYPDTEVGIAQMVGLACQGFAKAFKQLRPDIIVILGDRYEMLAAATAAHITRIPIAHLHGGEASEGAIDEAFRHAITKMSTWHFTSTDEYRRRVIQLGERPEYVYNFGAPGLDALYHQILLNKKRLAEDLGFDLSGKIAIVTYHPVTLEQNTGREQIKNLLTAIRCFDFKAIITAANADAYGGIINAEISRFLRRFDGRYKFVSNLGLVKYLSCLNCFDLVIGNSSSGISEAPSFKIPVVNIGDRQNGRIRAKNIIDVGYSTTEIKMGIQKALSGQFKNLINNMSSPYDRFRDGKTSWRIKQVLKMAQLGPYLLKKRFNDLNIRVCK